jgi:O-antigen ligase
MNRAKLDGWCEQGILGLVLGILVFGPLAFGAQGTWEFLVIQGMTMGVMALWAARFWLAPKPQLLWPPICWAVLAFMVYAVARYLQADIEYVARYEMIRVLIYGFLFFAILNNLHRQDSIQIITLTLIFLGMAIACYAVFQYLTKSEHIWNVHSSYVGRGSGTFIYPNHLAGFLEMLLPVALCYVLIGRLGQVAKIFIGYAALIILAGIGATLSRGGWVVTMFELVLLCGLLAAQRDYRIQGLVLLGVLLLCAAIALPRVQGMRLRVQQTTQSGKPDDVRLALWQSAISIWRENILWGSGPAHFNYRFPQYRPTQVQLTPDRVHNDYLNTLADWGLVGAGLVAAAWVLLYCGVLKTWRDVRGGRDDFSRKKSSKFALLIGASVGLLACLAHCLVDFNLQIPANAILAITLMAMLSSQWRHATERFWFRAGITLRCVATILLLAGIAYLGREGLRSEHEHYWLKRANSLVQPAGYMQESSSSFSRARIAALEQAFAADPENFHTSYALAECYRFRSWNGGDDYVALARQAIEWYRRGMKLNPYDGYNWLGCGMCLDWIASSEAMPEDSTPYYSRAEALDPNDYSVIAYTGWHYVQMGDPAAARVWFEQSQRLQWLRPENKIAYEYLPIVEKLLREGAAEHK